MTRKKIESGKNIIYCEDEKSSKIYLQSLAKVHNKRNFEIKSCSEHGDYVNMINSSIEDFTKYKEKEIKYIKYIVVDLDKSTETGQEKKLKEFKSIAETEHFEVIYCEPNFEMFLLLHFENCYKTSTKDINKKLISYINKEYNKKIQNIREIKSDNRLFTSICEDKDRILEAVKNSENIRKNNNCKMNFHSLVELIIKD